ncbi:MAG: hypothetical protein GY756_10170 [bacterium]|nr:hypothetical protein [bacterium]
MAFLFFLTLHFKTPLKMALIKTGAIVTHISGKLGGQSFASSNGNSYIKNIGCNSRKATSKQLAQRNITASISSKFRNLTPAQIATFDAERNNYPYKNRLGITSYYPAVNLFQKLNQGRVSIGEPILLNCPAYTSVYNTTFQFYNHAANRFTILGQGVFPLQKYLIYATNGLSPGIQNPEKYFKKITLITNAQLTAGYDFLSEYEAVFGPALVGSKVFLGICPVVISTGFMTGIKSYVSEIVDI